MTPANIAGNWTLSTISSKSSAQTTITSTVAQNGPSISGSVNIAGSACAKTGSFLGAITGDSLAASLVENEPDSTQQSVSLVGTVSPDGISASGTYAAPQGGCTNGDVGTWTGTMLNSVSNPNGTPAGTYPITVNATSGSATITTTVTLIVM